MVMETKIDYNMYIWINRTIDSNSTDWNPNNCIVI